MKKYKNIALNNQYIILGLQQFNCPLCQCEMYKKEYLFQHVIELICYTCRIILSNVWPEDHLYHERGEFYFSIKDMCLFFRSDDSILLLDDKNNEYNF
jgi:hypothetical protein